MSERRIIHADMDAFFAAVETLDDPSLRGKPVVVGGASDARGVVAAASYEARRFGIHSAMSMARAERLCPRLVRRPPRFGRYAEISGQVFDIFRAFTPLVEGVSIDEAFLDVTGTERLFGPAEAVGREIKRRVKDETKLTVSVGVAPNKFLAKVASDLEKPDGFVVIASDEAEARLAPLEVSRLWGVGPVTARALARMGIQRVGDLAAFPRDLLEVELGSYAEHLLELARGEDDRPVVIDDETKSIGAETTFARDIADAPTLRRHLDGLVERVAHELRDAGYRARTVHLKARYADFTTVTRSHTLASPAAATRSLREVARTLLETRLGRAGRPLRLVGFSVSNLVRPELGQMELFEDEDEAREEELDRLVDDVRDRYGRDALGRASGLAEPEEEEEEAGEAGLMT